VPRSSWWERPDPRGKPQDPGVLLQDPRGKTLDPRVEEHDPSFLTQNPGILLQKTSRVPCDPSCGTADPRLLLQNVRNEEPDPRNLRHNSCCLRPAPRRRSSGSHCLQQGDQSLQQKPRVRLSRSGILRLTTRVRRQTWCSLRQISRVARPVNRGERTQGLRTALACFMIPWHIARIFLTTDRLRAARPGGGAGSA
jgi:hypothetical protein